MNQASSTFRPERWALAALVILCLSLRLAVIFRFQHSLGDDRDAYLAIAQGIAAGRGFSVPGSEIPTAFRPPLYPCLIAPVSGPGQSILLGGLHILLAVGTVLLIWRSAANLKLGVPARCVAAAIFVFDPLSLRYAAFPMMETTSEFLIALLLSVLTRAGPFSGAGSFFAGLAFGACVLCRPTFWAFGVIYASWWLVGCLWRKQPFVQQGLAGLTGVMMLVLPWTLRNWAMLGTPIIMTTHGGYTMLLGNNEAFYNEVVDQPLGTIWDGSHGGGQAAWIAGVNEQLDRLGLRSEVTQDRWMSAQAWQTIGRSPARFLRAALIKFLWFWNIAPHAPAAEGLPGWSLWLIGGFYVLLWIALLAGLGRFLQMLFRSAPEVTLWLAPALLIISLTAVHLVYWSDARMRAPLVPAIALLSVAWWPGGKPADSATQ